MFKNVKVRCWKVEPDFNNSVFITYPDGFGGHELIICTNCGEIYAANTEAEAYEKPLDEKLSELVCGKCNKKLSETAKKYPENYLDYKGKLATYEIDRSLIMDDKSSIIKEFPSLYNC